ncbi:MAG: YidC/Oxa1 family membrane protein insertase [Lacisediminihabitans sp.]
MDLFSFPPIAAIFNGAYALVGGIAQLIAPVAGSASAAVSIIVLTVLVRTALIPVGMSQVKAEWVRRRLAPMLQALQRKYKKNPQLLQRKTMALYKAEKTSPLAGILPALAQAPVLSLVYALFLRTTVDGHANALLAEHLGGVPLGTSFVRFVTAGAGFSGLVVYAALFVILCTTAWLSRRIARRLAPLVSPSGAGTPLAGLAVILSWLPFITVVFAAFVPLAAALYLAMTTAWTLVERAVLRRRYWGETGLAVSGRPAVAGP